MKTLIKSLICVSVLVAAFSAQAEEIVSLKLSKLQGMVISAIVKEERSQGIKLSAKDVTELELVFVRTNEIEVAGIAPGHKEEDGIPNYCSVTLSRESDYSEYAVTEVHCSPWD
ncbi:MAG: hypothetical protein K0R29_2717 [Pseudobdellovibrio sp.]|jgi:hypothetical protein|nr:hypothetical protein [Pseudobdellovibrio sp.]